MRQMMEGVVLRGTGRIHARLKGYTSAGKTGTAQIFDSVTHHYSHNYNASFVGFAPVMNPALVVLVTVHNTSGESGQGADAAAPVFTAIMTEALRMLDVPRDIPEQEIAAKPGKKEKTYDDVSIADLGGDSIMDEDPSVRQLLAEQMQIVPATAIDTDIPPAPSLALASPGRGPASVPGRFFASPTPAVPPAPGNSQAQEPQVPDFRGKSMRDAMEAASARGIEVTVEGSGVARAQVPLPGTPLHSGDRIRIVFTR
jgi:cell division protein FtsI (penicillin-binding protein 3)